jgi:uncharacterized membrane protein YjfL (UPF0719 family)
MFTFSFLLVFTLVAAAVLFWLYHRRPAVPSVVLGRAIFLTFTALGVVAYFVLRGYLFPTDRYFGNGDFHHLEHLGYRVTSPVVLTDPTAARTALFPGGAGRATLETHANGARLRFDDLTQPLFRYRDETATLLNPYYDRPVAETIRIFRRDRLLVELRLDAPQALGWLPGRRSRAEYTARLRPEGTPHVLPLRTSARDQIRYAYGLRDLLQTSETLHPDSLTLALLDGSQLVRETQQRGTFTAAPLHLMPGAALVGTPGVRVEIDGQPARRRPAGSADLEPATDAFFLGPYVGAARRLRLQPTEGGWLLRYVFPTRYPLADTTRQRGVMADQSRFLHSSAGAVADDPLTAGYLFETGLPADSRNHLRALLHYRSGPATDPIRFRVLDQHERTPEVRTLGAGETFLLKTGQPGVSWQFRMVDQRAANPLQPQHLLLFLAGYLALVFLIVQVVGPGEIAFTELGLYLLLFNLLVLRSFLLWRLGTFPPTETTGAEFETLTRARDFWVTVGLTVAVLLLRLAWHQSPRWRWWGARLTDDLRTFLITAYQKTRNTSLQWVLDRLYRGLFDADDLMSFFVAYALVWVGLSVVVGLGAAVAGLEVERLLTLFVPVAVYLFFSYHHYGRRPDPTRYHRPTFRLPFRQEVYEWDYYKLFNTGFVLAFLAVFDTGFGILFLLFVLFQEFVTAVLDFSPVRANRYGAVVVFGAAFVGLVFGMSHVVSVLTRAPRLTYWLLLGLGLGALVALLRNYRFEPQEVPAGLRRRAVWGSALVLGLALALLGQRETDRFTATRYRAEILIRPVDELIAALPADSDDLGAILRAAQSQWFINSYIHHATGATLRPDAFNPLPHFDKGVGYTTQTRDTVVPRYVIAEHSEGLVIGLVLLFLALSVYVSLYRFGGNEQRREQGYEARQLNRSPYLVLTTLNLLLVIALFVWLAATNRIVFFGQDFPLLSLKSNFTVLFTLFLILIAAVFSRGGRARTRLVRLYAGPPLVLAGVTAGLLLAFGSTAFNDAQFDINLSKTQLAQVVDDLNAEWDVLQDENPRLTRLDTTFGYFRQRSRRLADYLAVDSLTTPFSRSALNQLLTADELRDETRLLHVIRVNDRYRLAIQRNYFLDNPAEHLRATWAGHVLAGRVTDSLRIRALHARAGTDLRLPTGTFQPRLRNEALLDGYLDYAVLPAGWLRRESNPVVLASVRASGGAGSRAQLALLGRAADRAERTGADRPAFRLFPGDHLLVTPPDGGATQVLAFYQQPAAYLMKNAFVNGRQTYFYPRRERFLWAFNYANYAGPVLSTDTTRRRSVQTALDADLMDALDAVLGTDPLAGRRDVAVTVLDGAGRVRALADRKGERLPGGIDPNDTRRVRQIQRDQYFVRRSSTGRAEWGNLNLLRFERGPGSSFKPLAYTAVASQYQIPGGWGALRLDAYAHPSVFKPNTRGTVVRYARQRLSPWDLTKEVLSLPMDAQQYLIQSRNLYHSAVLFLGSYPKATLQRRWNEVLTRPSDPLDFPRLSVGAATGRAFNASLLPASVPGSDARDYFGNPASLLGLGLLRNYDLPTSKQGRAARQYFEPLDAGLLPEALAAEEAFSGYRNWSQPELSHFFQEDRSTRQPNGSQDFNPGIKNGSLGSRVPIEVTPLRMAELGGRLLSLNKHYEAHLTETGTRRPYAFFEFDAESWRSKAEFLRFQQGVFGSLRRVLTEGTGRAFNARIDHVPERYYYAKTGTIGEPGSRNPDEDKLLLLVITDQDLSVDLTEEKLRRMKFYSVFITCYNGDRLSGNSPAIDELRAKLINAIQRSEGFRRYFNQP